MRYSLFLRAAVLLLLLLQCTSARADDAKKNAELLKSQPNGCGSGWSVYLVLDSIPLAHCTFRAACDGHDDCYGKCEGRVQDRRAPQCEYLRCRQGGDLFKQPACQSDPKFAKLDRERRSAAANATPRSAPRSARSTRAARYARRSHMSTRTR